MHSFIILFNCSQFLCINFTLQKFYFECAGPFAGDVNTRDQHMGVTAEAAR